MEAQRDPMRSKKARGGRRKVIMVCVWCVLTTTSLVHMGRQAREGGSTRLKAGEGSVQQFAGQWRGSGEVKCLETEG